MDILNDAVKQILTDWKYIDPFDNVSVNQFIDKYEFIFMTYGLFFRGLRVEPVSTDDLSDSRHKTLDGVLGILSMNICILKKKFPIELN